MSMMVYPVKNTHCLFFRNTLDNHDNLCWEYLQYFTLLRFSKYGYGGPVWTSPVPAVDQGSRVSNRVAVRFVFFSGSMNMAIV